MPLRLRNSFFANSSTPLFNLASFHWNIAWKWMSVTQWVFQLIHTARQKKSRRLIFISISFPEFPPNNVDHLHSRNYKWQNRNIWETMKVWKMFSWWEDLGNLSSELVQDSRNEQEISINHECRLKHEEEEGLCAAQSAAYTLLSASFRISDLIASWCGLEQACATITQLRWPPPTACGEIRTFFHSSKKAGP